MAVDTKIQLQPFTQHGAVLKTAGEWARGTCPLCGSTTRSPFGVHVAERRWKCQVCGKGGDLKAWFVAVVERNVTKASPERMVVLAEDRGLSPETLAAWSVGYHGGVWTVPVRTLAGTITNIQIVNPIAKAKPHSTKGGKNAVIICTMDDYSAPGIRIWVCEGQWDAMSLWEALRAVGEPDLVVGLAGASSANEHLAQACQVRSTVLCYDNDDAGRKGDARARTVLQGRARSVASVHWTPTAADGYDVRNLRSDCAADPEEFLASLRALVQDGPPGASRVLGPVGVHRKAGGPTGSGLTRDEVIKQFRKWLHMPDPTPVDVVFGSILANRLDGDPLWLFLVGPSGCGKSELLMSVRKSALITFRDTITRAGLVYGKAVAPGAPDPSLLSRLRGRVLVVKDFTTILKRKEDALEEFFGVLRSAYDGYYSTSFGGVEREYPNCKFGFVAGVTSEIERFGASHAVAGERFIKHYMTRVRRSLSEDKQIIKTAVANQPHKTEMQAALDGVAHAALDRVDVSEPEIPDRMMDKLIGIGMWVAAMRGQVTRDRYSHELVFMPSTEVGTRVANQFRKLASGVAIFRERARVGPSELAIVARVARETCPDFVEAIVRELYVQSPTAYASWIDIVKWTRLDEGIVSSKLSDMEMLGLVQKPTGKRARGTESWRLTRSLMGLMRGLDLYVPEKRWRRR